MVKKILVLCFDVYDRPFPEDHISNTKLEKGDHYYIQTMARNKQCPETMSRKALENTNEICPCSLGIL